MNLEDVQQLLRERLDALGPAPSADLLRVLMLPDYERAGAIGEYWANPKTRPFAELLIDAEESCEVRAVRRTTPYSRQRTRRWGEAANRLHPTRSRSSR